MADFASLARGLLTLEINTVEKDGMSGQKMPTGPNALVEVVQAYWDFLCSKAGDFGPKSTPLPSWARKLSRSFRWGREPFPQPPGEERTIDASGGEPQPAGYVVDFLREPPTAVTPLVLDHLREIAAWMAEMRALIQILADGQRSQLASLREKLDEDGMADVRQVARRLRPAERSVFHRIRRNCDQFKAILKSSGQDEIVRTSPENVISSTDLVPLRKAWDIGTEIILLQTVIQIDGDVVSRFQAGLEGTERTELQALHANAVDISFKYWRWLIDAVGKIAGQTVSSLLRSG